MSKETYMVAFDRLVELVKAHREVDTFELDVMGGEVTLMPYEFWEEMLPYTLERMKEINQLTKGGGTLMFTTNCIFKDKRYIDLLNRYSHDPLLILFTSWEPDTDRFGKRGGLFKRFCENVKAINTQEKTLNLILTQGLVDVGAKYVTELIDEIGITNVSIEQLSPFGSGKSFFDGNMTTFGQMSDFLIELRALLPKNIEMSPYNEFVDSIELGKPFSFTGNYKYDLDIEPNGDTHFNACQTGSERINGASSGVLNVHDPMWVEQVMFDNTTEELRKINTEHNNCVDCRYLRYCNGGWFHGKTVPSDVLAPYAKGDCAGYGKIWKLIDDGSNNKNEPLFKNHQTRISKICESVTDATEWLSESTLLALNYEEYFCAVNGADGIRIDVESLHGKNPLERALYYTNKGIKARIDSQVYLDTSNALELVLEHMGANLNGLFVAPDVVWSTLFDNHQHPKANLILSMVNELLPFIGYEGDELACSYYVQATMDDRHEEVVNWILTNPTNLDWVVVRSDRKRDTENSFVASAVMNAQMENTLRASLSS